MSNTNPFIWAVPVFGGLLLIGAVFGTCAGEHESSEEPPFRPTRLDDLEDRMSTLAAAPDGGRPDAGTLRLGRIDDIEARLDALEARCPPTSESMFGDPEEAEYYGAVRALLLQNSFGLARVDAMMPELMELRRQHPPICVDVD